jgi:hypothetical protein
LLVVGSIHHFNKENIVKSMRTAIVAGMLLGFAATQPLTALAAPDLTVQSERAAHPRIVEAIAKMRESLRLLEAAPDDFGGNKAAAIADTKRAIHSLKKALYFRLKMDDAAIEAAQ